MSKPIDLAYIERMMAENPDDWYQGEEAHARFEAGLKKALDITGPQVKMRTVKGYARIELFTLDIDFDVIEKRGRDLQPPPSQPYD